MNNNRCSDVFFKHSILSRCEISWTPVEITIDSSKHWATFAPYS